MDGLINSEQYGKDGVASLENRGTQSGELGGGALKGEKKRVIGLVGVMIWSTAEGRRELKRVRVLFGEMGGRARGQ